MRAQNDIREGAKKRHIPVCDHIADPVVIIESVLLLQYIQCCAADLSALQCLHQCIGVNELSSCRVDNPDTVLHPRKGLPVQKVVVFLRRISVKRDDIRFFKKLLKGYILSIFLHRFILVGIVAQNLAAKAGKMLDDRSSDFARSDDADGLEADVLPDLLLQRIILQLGPLQDADNSSLQHHRQHNGIVGNT